MDLPLIEGVTRPAWQRRDVVVALLHRQCPRCAELRIALADPPGSLRELRDPELSVIVLDREDEGASRTLARAAEVRDGEAAVIVADRFSKIFAVMDPHSLPPGDFLADLAAWVDAVQRQCGECSRQGAEAPLTSD